MELRLTVFLFLLFFILNGQYGDSLRTKRHLLDFRKMMKVFVRYNIKTNVVPYTSIFAFAMGFRANWDIKPSTIIHPKRKISEQQYQSQPYPYNQYQNYQYQNNQYQNNQYQNNQRYYSPPSHYQRAIHSAVKGTFDWHGLNGTACLQRTLCEVSVIHHDDIISHILRVVFNHTEEVSCPEEIPCPISLVGLVDHVITGSGIVTSE